MSEASGEVDPNVEKAVQSDGSLFDSRWYLSWDVGAEHAQLDGLFTSKQLRDIADHMERGRQAHLTVT